MLLFGSEDEIRKRAVEQPTPTPDSVLKTVGAEGLVDEEFRELFPSGAPGLPDGLQPIQRARLADLLSFSHDQVRKVLTAARESEEEQMVVDWITWQQLLHLEKQLAEYLSRIAAPDNI